MVRFKLYILFALMISAARLAAWEYISADSLNSLITRSAVPFLVDVREHSDYLSSHIPGAALYPYNSQVLAARYANLPSDRPLVIICTTGLRSTNAAVFLEGRQDAVFSDIYVLQGGMNTWNYEVINNDSGYFTREQALCEMFTTGTCSFCYYANLYLDESIIPEMRNKGVLSLPRYRLGFPSPIPFTFNRDTYYGYSPIPGIFINGTETIDPNELTIEKIYASIGDSTQMSLDIFGAMTSGDSSVLELRVELEAGPRVDSLQYNLFVLITQDGLTNVFWDPPYFPSNGEALFNGTVRYFAESDTGRAFTIQPGETRFFDREITLDNTYSAAQCNVIAFVQNLDTRKVFQTDSRVMDRLQPFNTAPVITSSQGEQCIYIVTGDTLIVDYQIQDPDSNDRVTAVLNSWFSSDSITYEPYSSDEITLGDSTFNFIAQSSPEGHYRHQIVVTDRWALSDTLNLRVSISDTTQKCCDFSGDARVNVLDVVAFLFMLANDPDNYLLDWNEDGHNSIIDALFLLMDIRAGRCPTPQQPVSLLASTVEDENTYPAVPAMGDGDDIAWLKTVVAGMDIRREKREEFLAELTTLSSPAALPRAFSLAQNSPNPFNPSTSIRYNVPEGGAAVSLKVYNVRGRLLRVLSDGLKTAGEHTVFFDGRDSSGRQLPSGIYFYCLRSDEFSATRKMLLLK